MGLFDIAAGRRKEGRDWREEIGGKIQFDVGGALLCDAVWDVESPLGK